MKKFMLLAAIAFIVLSCNNETDHSMASGANANKERFQQFYDEVINAHNTAMIDSFVTADFVDHNPSPGHTGKGIEDVKAMFNEMLTAIPDIKATTNFMVTSGDTLTAYVTMSGTNTGPMGTMPPTNKSFKINGIDIIVMKDGKATERWGVFEDLSMMTQLGLIPSNGAPQTSNTN